MAPPSSPSLSSPTFTAAGEGSQQSPQIKPREAIAMSKRADPPQERAPMNTGMRQEAVVPSVHIKATAGCTGPWGQDKDVE